jgi:uncharacterized protein YndB with AHSA1/START domain
MEIDAPPESVWEAITKKELIDQWNPEWTFESQALEPGATYIYRDLQGEPVISGEILEVDAPRRFVSSSQHQWSDEVRAEKPSRVTYEITPRAGGCRLTVVHDSFENEDSPTYKAVKDGWPGILANLKAFAEGGKTAVSSPAANRG